MNRYAVGISDARHGTTRTQHTQNSMDLQYCTFSILLRSIFLLFLSAVAKLIWIYCSCGLCGTYLSSSSRFFFCHRFDTLLKMCINRREKNCVYSTLKCKIKMHLKLRTWWIGVQIKWDFKTCEAWVRASSNTFQGFVEWKKCSNANSRNHAVIGAYLYGLFRLLYD